MSRAQPAVSLQRRVRCGAALHVDPDQSLDLSGRAREAVQARVQQRVVDSQTKLSELDRKMGGKVPLGNGLQGLQVLTRSRIRLTPCGDILAKQGQQG